MSTQTIAQNRNNNKIGKKMRQQNNTVNSSKTIC